MLDGCGEPEGRAEVHRLHARASSSRPRCRTTCTSTRWTPSVALPADWATLGADVAATPSRSRPRTSPRTAPSGCGTGATSPAGDLSRTEPVHRTSILPTTGRRHRGPRRGAAGRAGGVLPLPGRRHGGPRVLAGRALRPRCGAVGARPTPGAPGAVVHALVGRARHVAVRRARGAGGVRAAPPAVPGRRAAARPRRAPLRAADRGRRGGVPAPARAVRPARRAAPRRHRRGDRGGTGVLQRQRGGANGRCLLGGPGPSHGGGGRRAGRRPGAGLRAP